MAVFAVTVCSVFTNLWETTVPHTCVVSKTVPKDYNTLYPTFQNLMLRQIIKSGNLLFDSIVI